jgi:hypothetical protein
MANEEFTRRGSFMVWDYYLEGESFTIRNKNLISCSELFTQNLFVKHVQTIFFCDPIFLNNLFSNVTRVGGEGVVYRIDPCLQYEGDSPSPNAWKRTATYTAEGVCVSVARGMGKRKDMLGAMYLKLPTGAVIAVGGGKNMDDALLTRLYSNPPLGKQVTFSFKEYAKTGMPLRPQFVSVRDYE